jgi:Mn2+/Fe2+ NRAMP family transporter
VILTLIGDTIGGYILYAGPHRLLDSGVSEPHYARDIDQAAVGGVLLTGLMRVVVFLAVLGVVAGGATLAPANPTASAGAAARVRRCVQRFAVAVGDRRASVGGMAACGSAARAPVSAVAALSGWGGVYLAVRSFAGLL